MKYSLVIALILGSASAQPAPAPKTAPKTDSKATPALTIPQGSVEIEPNIFKYTDKSGAIFYYRRSPFGVQHYVPPTKDSVTQNTQTRPSTPLPTTVSTTETQAVEQGDSVKFTRPGPFGVYTWIRKKSELSEEEKEAFEKTKVNSATAHSKTASPKKDQ